MARLSRKSSPENLSLFDSLPLFAEDQPRAQSAIIWIDKSPLLARESQHCADLLDQLENLHLEVEAFRQESQPRYRNWLRKEFSAKFEPHKRLRSRLARLLQLTISVESEAALWGCSETEAFMRVEKIQGDARPFLDAPFEDVFFSSDFPDPDEDLFDAKHFNGSPSEENFARDLSKTSRHRRRESTDAEELRRKALYRKLARKLHPDHNRDLPQKMRELWFDVQEAWEEGSVESLESLVLLLEGGNSASTSIHLSQIKSLDRLQSVRMDLRRRLDAVSSYLRKARKSLAWNFDTLINDPTRIEKLRLKIEEDFAAHFERLAEAIQKLEKRIEGWRNQQAAFENGKLF